MSRKQPVTLSIPGHVVIFRYEDVPGEWHAMALETSAFGWGPTFDRALEALAKSLEGQYGEAIRNGNAGLIASNPDPEWVEVYRKGKHPQEPRLKALFCGQVTFSVAIGSGRPRVAIPRHILVKSFLKEDSLQAV